MYVFQRRHGCRYLYENRKRSGVMCVLIVVPTVICVHSKHQQRLAEA